MPKSMHGKVQSYFMPLEEFYQKYGFYPPKHPDLIKKMGGEKAQEMGEKHLKKRKNWHWAKITLQQYLDLKDQGKLDSEIIKEHPWLTYEKLHHLKKKWGLVKE